MTVVTSVCGDAQGTRAGYLRHWRRSDPACRACKDAVNRYQQGLKSYRQTRDKYNRKRRVGNRRPSVHDYVLSILETVEPSWLPTHVIIDRVRELLPASSETAVRQALQRHRTAGMIERTDNGKWRVKG